jgi:hypothetical protein
VLVCWLSWRCGSHNLEPKSSGIGTPDKNSLFEFPNQESRMPISMQEFGENACMIEGIRRLSKNIIKTIAQIA